MLRGWRKLNVIIKALAPTCFACGEKGHIKRRCPLHISKADKGHTEYVGLCNENGRVTREEVEEIVSEPDKVTEKEIKYTENMKNTRKKSSVFTQTLEAKRSTQEIDVQDLLKDTIPEEEQERVTRCIARY